MSEGIKRVLYVDDEADIRVIVQMALELRPEFRVHAVASGPETLDYLCGGGRADVILIDVMMPEMTGPELLNELRGLENAAAIPVIFITAKARQGDIDSYHDLGAAGVITKPFDPLSLADQILTFL